MLANDLAQTLPSGSDARRAVSNLDALGAEVAARSPNIAEIEVFGDERPDGLWNATAFVEGKARGISLFHGRPLDEARRILEALLAARSI